MISSLWIKTNKSSMDQVLCIIILLHLVVLLYTSLTIIHTIVQIFSYTKMP